MSWFFRVLVSPSFLVFLVVLVLLVSLVSLVGESLGFAPAVDEGCDAVHQQDGEADAFGVGSPGADDDGQQAAAGTEDELSALGHGRGDHVGGHEAGAEHDAAREDGGEWVGIGRGVDSPEDGAEEGGGADKGHGDMPRDDSAAQQVDGAYQDSQGADFTQ